ncbi:hypothetical protein TEA_022838 [Camellia sinensis var. sinensis]|uniref:Aspartate aminotransferase n=1 Tax=Camellia sinensis var. sinensis TaxID=542762 RepID=A0A4S4E0B0_CAMSN|nr:hypothetical protein TEA_022838 [Camellia sinensis var. sinensis]
MDSISASPTSGFDANSVFAHVVRAPEDPILGVTVAYNKDPSPIKLNLGVGAYRTEEGKPLVLNVVRKAEQILVNDSSRVKEYLPIVGLADFNKLSAKLIFGADSPAIQENRVTTVQCLSANMGNHPKIFTIGGLSVKTYSYYDPATRGLNFQGLLDDLSSAPSGAIVLLHACAHNPTGVDPTLEQWEQIRKLMRSKGLLPFFDSAYQGFASGSLDADAQSVRMFVADGGECLVAQSYAKNMGLYGERVGALSIVCKNADVASRVESQLKLKSRRYELPLKFACMFLLILFAVTNLLVNLIGVWFFRNYARINLVYRKAEDMNYHSVCLHVLADSIRRVKNAEVLCLGLVSVTVFMLVMPLFRATGGVLLQMAPPSIPSSALSKCWRQVMSREDVSEVSQARFWELVPGRVVGSLTLQVKKGMDERPILQYVHGLYHDLGVHDLTVQTDYA